MATASAPVLSGITLPIPAKFSFDIGYIGGTLEMADGSYVHDLVDDGEPRHTIQISWIVQDDSELASLLLAYDTLAGASVAFTTVTGISIMVSRPEGGKISVDLVTLHGGTLAYNVSFSLVEVPA